MLARIWRFQSSLLVRGRCSIIRSYGLLDDRGLHYCVYCTELVHSGCTTQQRTMWRKRSGPALSGDNTITLPFPCDLEPLECVRDYTDWCAHVRSCACVTHCCDVVGGEQGWVGGGGHFSLLQRSRLLHDHRLLAIFFHRVSWSKAFYSSCKSNQIF